MERVLFFVLVLIASVHSKESVVIVGGKDTSSFLKSTALYNATDGSFRTLPDVTVQRYGVGVAALQGRVYAAGGASGWDAKQYALASAELFNVSHWHTIAPMSSGRRFHALVALGEHIYAVAGEAESGKFLTAVERYSPKDNAWSSDSVAPLPVRLVAPAAAVVGDCLYVTGGSDGKVVSNAALKYCLSTRVWQKIANMSTPRHLHAAAALGGNVYVCGGWASGYHASCERYNPESNQWSDVASLPSARVQQAMAAVKGRILSFGGLDKHHKIHAEVLSYDVKDNSWSQLADMPSARAGHGVATLTSGGY